MPPTNSKAGAATELQNAVSSAMTTFMKAANQALAAVEDSNKDAIRRAIQESREAQRERDELRHEREVLMKEKLTMAMEIETMRGELERWKAANDKAEWMINHQSETIAQLRKESQQWKDQFIRVDEERLRLSSRNDELVTHQLHANRRESRPQEPLTPRSQGPRTNRSTTSSTRETPKITTSTNPTGYLTDGDIITDRRRSQPTKSTATRSKSSANRKLTAKSNANAVAGPSREAIRAMTSVPAQSKVIGTYHVVMQGAPVKDESEEQELSFSDDYDSFTERPESPFLQGEETPDDDDEDYEKVPPLIRGRRRVSAVGNNSTAPKAGTSRRRWTQDRQIIDDDDEEEEIETPRESRTGNKSNAPTQTVHSRVVPDDEDEDELRLGGPEDRLRKAQAHKAAPLTDRRQSQSVKRPTTAVKGKKRNSPYPTAAAGKKARR